MANKRLRAGQLSVGQPLPFDAYDERGTLLMRCGSIIASAAQLECLIEHGLFRDETPEPTVTKGHHVSVVRGLAELREPLRSAFAETDPQVFPAMIIALARRVRELSLLDPDAAIGGVALVRGSFYPVRQAVNCAALGALLLVRQEVTDADIEACLCAMLTMNLSIVDLQDNLYRESTPLTDVQKAVIAAHPAATVALLRARGVSSGHWLDIVMQHHERLDGSGYPGAISGESVHRHARLTTIADQYCALVSEREFREGLNPGAALKHLLINQGKGLDPILCALLIRELTPYPPGAVVRLANGEIAIVCRRMRHPEQPIVRSVAAADGRRFETPRKRVTSNSAYRVEALISQSEARELPAADVLWDDSFVMEPA